MKIPFCVYCRKSGHTREEYKKLKKPEKSANSESTPSPNNNIKCYGCGASGVIRANYAKCSNRKESFYVCNFNVNDCKCNLKDVSRESEVCTSNVSNSIILCNVDVNCDVLPSQICNVNGDGRPILSIAV